MDAMQDKQKFIQDEWAVIRIAGSLWPLCVGAVLQNLPQISSNMTSPYQPNHNLFDPDDGLTVLVAADSFFWS